MTEPPSDTDSESDSGAKELANLTQSLTPPRRFLILIAVSMCAMLHSMASTSVAVVLPQLQGSLSATPDQISWVVTLAVIGAVVTTPLTGWLSDRIGWRRLVLITVTGFAISTALCATAQSLAPMLVYRTLQGAFGAPMIPIAQAILLATYADSDRAWSQSVHGIATVLGQAMAPVIGGYFALMYDWRWSFLFLIPLAVVAIVMTVLWVPNGGQRAGARLDWYGFAALSIGIGAFQLALDRGQRLDWFESNLVVIYFLVALVGFTVFLLRNLIDDRPFMDFRLFRNPQFAVGTVIIVIFGMVSFLPNFVYPILLGNLQGYPETTIGWLLFIRGTGLMLGFMVVSTLSRRFPRATLSLGFLLSAVSGIQGIYFSLDMEFQSIAVTIFLQGLGVALIWVPVVVLSFSTIPPVLMAQASALFHLLRQVATSVSLAVVVTVTMRTGSISYSELSWNISPYSDNPLGKSIWYFESQQGLMQLSAEVGRQSQMIGYSNAFVLYTIGCFIGAVLPFLAVKRKHNNKSSL